MADLRVCGLVSDSARRLSANLHNPKPHNHGSVTAGFGTEMDTAVQPRALCVSHGAGRSRCRLGIFRAFEENWVQRIHRLKSPQPLPEGTLAGAAEAARRVLREEVSSAPFSTRGMSPQWSGVRELIAVRTGLGAKGSAERRVVQGNPQFPVSVDRCNARQLNPQKG